MTRAKRNPARGKRSHPARMRSRYPRRKKAQQSKTSTFRFDYQTGLITTSHVAASVAETQHYFDCHDLVPKTVELMTVAQLHELLRVATVFGNLADWKCALITLAHHGSKTASTLLCDIEAQVPAALHGFWELAYSESLELLGHDAAADETGLWQILPIESNDAGTGDGLN